MSTENVKKFYEAVSQDEVMKQKFVELSQKYHGQQMDEEKVSLLLEKEALPLAAQMGYSFTMEDLKTYGEEMQQANMDCELSESELEAVSGGVMVCFIGGGGDGGVCVFYGLGPNGICALVGSTHD